MSDAQLDEASEWAQQRLQRKFDQDQQRNAQHWDQLVSSAWAYVIPVGWIADSLTLQVGDNLQAPLRLNAIRFIGTRHTRPQFLSKIIASHLPDLPPASYLDTSTSPSAGATAGPTPQTLRSVLETATELTSTLSKFDIFSAVAPTLEASPGVLSEREDVDLVFRVAERSKYMLRTATDVGNGEGSAVGSRQGV